jgi:ABC-type lipoprotein export system ATPase subunit
LHEARGTILVVVTHNPNLAARFDRRYELDNRRLEPRA